MTIRIDEETLRRARIRALEEGTSVNAVVSEFLTHWATADEASAQRRLVELANRTAVDAHYEERDWTRDDLYEERTRWPRS